LEEFIMAAVKVTVANFEEEVLKSDKPVLVDFWAAWCGPCQMVGPVVEEIAEENPDLKVCKIDVDASPELAQKYGVMSIPTLVAIKNGVETNRTMGAQPKETILSIVK
jgi:thioredoxin 1